MGSSSRRAIALLLVNRAIIPMVDCLAKLLQLGGYSQWQVLWARFTTQTLFVLPLCLWYHGATALWRGSNALVIGRGLLQFLAVICFYTAVKYVPLADAAAIIFLSPVLVVMLAAVALRERVAPRRWVATAVGLSAVLIIVRPGFAHFQPAFLLLLLCACALATYNVMTRMLRSTPAMLLYTYQILVGFVPLTALSPFYLVAPATAYDGGMMLLLGLLALVAHGLVILAMTLGEASMLAPFFYLEIVGQVLLGLAVFGELPDTATWLGMSAIVAVGVYLSLTESARTASAADAPPADCAEEPRVHDQSSPEPSSFTATASMISSRISSSSASWSSTSCSPTRLFSSV